MTVPWAWLAAAAAAPAPTPDQPAPPAEAQWAAPKIVGQDCRRGGEDEIVVCGRRDPDRYRVRTEGLPDPNAERRLGLDLGDGVRAELDPLTVHRPDGLVDKRVMLHFKFKF